MALNELREYIVRQILPVRDLGLKKQPTAGLTFPDDIPPVLSVGVAQGPSEPHLVVSDDLGMLRSRPGGPVGPFNIVPPRTDVAAPTLLLPDLTRFSFVELYTIIEAIATGTTSFDVHFDLQDSQGNWMQDFIAPQSFYQAQFSAKSLGGNVGYSESFGPNLRLRTVFGADVLNVTWYVDAIGM